MKFPQSLILLGMLLGCSEPQATTHSPFPEAPASAVYFNARVYTLDHNAPWSEAIVTTGRQIAFVGSTPKAMALASDNALKFDLQGRFVMPGIVDSHTHPGLVAILGGDDEETDAKQSIAPGSKEQVLAWLEDYASNSPSTALFVTLGEWDVAEFLPGGPHKQDLDVIFPDKPVLLFDNSGHSMWVNSAMLSYLGIDENIQDLSEGISYFVRDEHGELTGWAKEFALMPYIGDMLLPDEHELRERLRKHLDFLASRGVTTVWDGGNFSFDDAVYSIIAELDGANLLPVRYEGSYHIWKPSQVDAAKSALLELRREYEGRRLKFNTIKIHYDGIAEILTAGMLEPYATDSDNFGGVLFSAQRLSEFMLELDEAAINIHLHVVGDRATRNALDAVEMAQSKRGGPLSIEVTLSHLETVAPSDIKRFKSLGVYANFTPHWFSEKVFGRAGAINLGPERANRSQVVNQFVEQGANITLSSDVVSGSEAHRADPFIGMEMSITHQEFSAEANAPLGPENARLSLESAIAGYTINGARQLGLSDAIGSLAVGKLADFVVLDRDPFSIDSRAIHTINPVAPVIEGRLAGGGLEKTNASISASADKLNAQH